MANPICPKCEKTAFETNTIKPAKTKAAILVLNCASCGAVVGAMEPTILAAHITELHNKLVGLLGAIDQKLIGLQFKR